MFVVRCKNMSDYMAVFMASMAVMLIITALFLLTLKRVMNLEKRLS